MWQVKYKKLYESLYNRSERRKLIMYRHQVKATIKKALRQTIKERKAN